MFTAKCGENGKWNLQGDSSGLDTWVGLTLILDVPWIHCQPNSVWVESAGQLSNLVDHPNPSQPNSGLRADETPFNIEMFFVFYPIVERYH